MWRGRPARVSVGGNVTWVASKEAEISSLLQTETRAGAPAPHAHELLCSGSGGLRHAYVLDRSSEPCADRFDHAKIVRGERILPSAIQSQDSDDSRRALKWHRQRRAQRAVLPGIVQISRFD